MTKAQEHKSFSASATKVVDADQGIVEHIVAVMGNVDRGDDVIHPGAFGKTIMERGLKVKVLDQHDTRSVESVIGKPLELREVGRLELPPGLTDDYPDATGALMAKTQFLLDTNRGREAFARIKSGAVDEYSIGYDPITSDYSTIEDGEGKKKTIRNLRELRLWEYSPVVFAMNPAATTVSAKDDGQPEEAKPWNVFEQDGEYCVYKLDADGEPDGDPLGCHESVDEAEAQMAALYAQEAGEAETAEGEAPEEAKAPNEREDMDTPKADEGPEVVVDGVHYVPEQHAGGESEVKVGRVLAARNARRLEAALATLTEILKDAGLVDLGDEEEAEEKGAGDVPAETDQDAPPEGAADDAPAEPEAGPEAPPTSERMALLRKLQVELLEVDKQ